MIYNTVFALNSDGSQFGFYYNNCQYMPFGDAENSHHLLTKKIIASNFYGAVKILKDLLRLTGNNSAIFISDEEGNEEVYKDNHMSKINNVWTLESLNNILKNELDDDFGTVAKAENDQFGRMVIRGNKRDQVEHWLVLPSMVENNIRSIARQTLAFS